MDAVPLEKAPQVAVYAPPNAAPWDDAVTMALKYAGIDFAKVWDAEVLRRAAAGARLAPPAPRGLHRPVLQVLRQLRRRALAGRHGRAEHRGWRAAGLPQRAGAQAGGGGARSRPSSSRAGSCSRCAPRPRRWTSRWPAPAPTSRPATPTGRRWRPDASSKMDWSRALAFQEAQLELSPTTTSFSDIDGHQVNDPVRRQPLGAFTPVQLQRQDRSGGDDAGAEPPRGDSRFLRADHLVPPRPAQAERDGAGRRDRAPRGSSTSTASGARAPGPSTAGTTPRTRSTRSATRRPISRSTPIHRATG